MVTGLPEGTRFSGSVLPDSLPMTLTSQAGRISSPRLAGVGPKKMQTV